MTSEETSNQNAQDVDAAPTISNASAQLHNKLALLESIQNGLIGGDTHRLLLITVYIMFNGILETSLLSSPPHSLTLYSLRPFYFLSPVPSPSPLSCYLTLSSLLFSLPSSLIREV